MYTQRIIHTPAVGKSQELRAVLLERNASGNADAPHALSVNLFSPQAGYVHAIRFENLAALEAYQERPSLRESTFQEQGRRIDQCLAQERVTFLYEEVASTGTPSSTPKFLIRNRLSQAPGKGAELRAVLEERLRTATPGLAGARLSQLVVSLNGPAYSTTLLFGSMADMDTFRAAQRNDPTFQPFLSKVASLTRGPVQQRMQRILAPFPTQTANGRAAELAVPAGR